MSRFGVALLALAAVVTVTWVRGICVALVLPFANISDGVPDPLIKVGLSFGRVHTLEYALDLDHLTQTVGERPLSNGLHYLGAPW